MSNDVCFYDVVFKKVVGSMRSKALKFVKNKLIEYYGSNTWVVEPIKDYNKTPYTVENINGTFVCNCQGYQMKLKRLEAGDLDVDPVCSHVLAVKLYAGQEAHNKALEKKHQQEGGVWSDR